MEILALLQCLEPYLATTILRQLGRIAMAMIVMTGRVTMLGISRWAGKGGSYRTVQRFFYTQAIPWATLFWIFFRVHIYCPEYVYLLVGDEVVVTKAGTTTYGLDRFFSSLYGRPVPSVSFFALSLVSVEERRSYPIRIQQVVRSEAEKAVSKAKKQKAPKEKRAVGRPKGSKNKDKTQVELTPELLRIQNMVIDLLKLITGSLSLTYLVLDGHFGNNHALQMTRQCDLQLISKLRYDAALYFVYDGPYIGKGPHKKYSDKVDYHKIPDKYLLAISTEDGIETRIYQAQMLHKDFAQPLNVVIITKFNHKTRKFANVNLFSSDLQLSYDTIMDYYSLRFQIEFNFRDAKQYWGLEDFMNVTETAVKNAANLSLFMVNLSYRLLLDFRQFDPDCSILDLKAHYRGYRYVHETIKLLPQKPEPILLARIFNQVASLGRIHAIQPGVPPG